MRNGEVALRLDYWLSFSIERCRIVQQCRTGLPRAGYDFPLREPLLDFNCISIREPNSILRSSHSEQQFESAAEDFRAVLF